MELNALFENSDLKNLKFLQMVTEKGQFCQSFSEKNFDFVKTSQKKCKISEKTSSKDHKKDTNSIKKTKFLSKDH